MKTPSKPGSARTRSWLAGTLALLMLGLGQSLAPLALAEETPEPTPSAETSTPADEAEPTASATPTVTAQARESATPTPSRPTPSRSAAGKPARSEAPAAVKAPARVAAVPNATAAREGKRYELAGGVTYWVPEQWVAGAELVLSGTGWLNADGTAGSIIAVKLDRGAVTTSEPRRHPVTGEELAGDVYGVVQADAQGDWTLRLPYPTAANSNAGWEPGQAHKLNLLTGSLLDGDVVRSGPADVTAAAVPTPTPTPTPTTPAPTTPAPTTPAPTTPAPTTPAPTTPAPEPTVPACAKEGSGVVTVTPATVELGGVLHVTGSGFCHPAGGGSTIGIKLDEGAISRLDASVHANKTIWALVDAAADGSFAIDLQLPDGTDAGQNGSVPALAGGAHTLQFLTGGLKPGDTKRSLESTPFQVNAPTPEPTPVPTTPAPTPMPTTPAPTTPAPTTPAPDPGGSYSDPADPSVGYTVPTTVKAGEPIVVSGTGWKVENGTAGSVLSVLLDAAKSGDPNTVYTKREVLDQDGKPVSDKRLHAVIQAAADGSWTATIPFPTAANAQLADGSWTEWAAGSRHQIRFLTGSSVDGDKRRSLAADFTIAGDSPVDPATQPPSWAHTTVSVGGATAWVQQDVATASGSTIKIKGANWTNQAGAGASTIALKLNRAGGQYTRTGSGIVAPPVGDPDSTIWKLFAPAGAAAQPNLIAIPASGNFEVEIDAPAGLVAGQLLTAQFQTGKFDAKDQQRSKVSEPLVVGGVPYVPGPDQDDVTCEPTTENATVTIVNPQVSPGGVLHVTGSGFCHPEKDRGGSVVAIKIDEGKYSRLNDAVHSNRTIWTIVKATASNGTFDIQLQLPDGTTSGPNGSNPGMSQGAHTLQFLTGSLKPNDARRTIKSAEFVVGDYRPTGMPDPVEATEDLTSATRNGVAASSTASKLTVTVPGAQSGDWIYLNTYAGGSPTSPWGDAWFRAGADGRVVANLTGITLPTGTSKLSVQSGNSGEVGKLLGWTSLTVAGGTGTETPTKTTTTVRSIAQTATTADDSDESTAPTTVPKAPVQRSSQLTGLSNGDATAKADGSKITVTLPKSAASKWVYVYLYSGASVAKAGWVQLNSAKAFTVDLKDLPDGRHRIVAVNGDGGIVGWVETTKGAVASTPTVPVTGTPAPAGSGAAPAAPADAALTQPGGGSMEPVLIGAAVAVLTAGGLALRRLSGTPKRVAR
ncbi:MAG: hypothetical protein QM582_03170 [Micropruina sp.]|uniref:hypothetical protein n=1 Tax=Micropruina sp. TaxID=2737536 RepID=UPI0039E47C48